MKPPFFSGEAPLTIDAKNRLLIPPRFRRLIAPEETKLDMTKKEAGDEALIVTLRNKIPFLYPNKYYQELANSQIPPDIMPNEALHMFAQLRFGLAHPIDWDNQGRIVLPSKLKERAGLDSAVTLIGINDHLELWDSKRWNERSDYLIANSAEIEKNAKEVLEKLLADRAKVN